mgnify:CR=1 FL=1
MEFPLKEYDGFSLPAGEYMALRLVIGEGEGRNWWCVVYPPLCTAAAADLPVMKYLCSNSFTDCQVSIEIPTGEQYGIVVSKDNAGLTEAINAALAELADDGSIKELEIEWFGSEI